MAVVRTFQRALKYLVPSWLSEGEGGKALRAVTIILDENLARARAAVNARFPSRAEDDALAMIGDDRGIERGRTETQEHYAERLIAWRYPRGHVVRGSAFAALNQISEYFGGVACWSIDVKGNRHDRAAGGTESFQYGYAWNWDGTTTPKGRFWFAADMAGITYGAEDAAAIRRLFTGPVKWKPAGTMQQWLVLRLDNTPAGPDGYWGTWSRNIAGTQTQTRVPSWRYWALDVALKVYAGNAASFCTQYNRPGGGTYAGNPAAYPATITLIGGASYAGNPANYPATLTLPDDGDPS